MAITAEHGAERTRPAAAHLPHHSRPGATATSRPKRPDPPYGTMAGPRLLPSGNECECGQAPGRAPPRQCARPVWTASALPRPPGHASRFSADARDPSTWAPGSRRQAAATPHPPGRWTMLHKVDGGPPATGPGIPAHCIGHRQPEPVAAGGAVTEGPPRRPLACLHHRLAQAPLKQPESGSQAVAVIRRSAAPCGRPPVSGASAVSRCRAGMRGIPGTVASSPAVPRLIRHQSRAADRRQRRGHAPSRPGGIPGHCG